MKVHILVIEDSIDDAQLIMHHIRKGGYEIQYERVDTAEMMKAALKEKKWDLVLSDYSMPHFNGSEALEILKESGIDIPFIIISGTIGEDVAVKTMKAGAHDYIMKNNLQRLLPAIERELAEAKGKAAQKHLEQKQKRADELQGAIYRISEATQTTTKLEELYRSIHTIIAELMPAQNFYISLYNKATDTISFPYFVDEFDTAPSPSKPGRGLTGYVLRTGNSLLTTPPLFEQLVKSGQIVAIGKPPVDWLGVPLKTQRGETIGMMAVQTYTDGVRLGATEQTILEFVSVQVAMAIERKRADRALQHSEEKYRTLVENLSDVIFTMDLQGLFTYISPVIEHYTGFRVKEVLGQPFTRFVHPDDLPGLTASFCNALSGQQEVYQFRVFDMNGTVRYVRTSSRTIEEDGKVVGLTGVMSDITEIMHAENKLRVLSRAVEQSPAMILITDTEGIIEYVNPKFVEVSGYSMTEVVGQKVSILKSGKMPDSIYKDMWDTILADKIWHGEMINKTKNDAFYWVNISIAPITDGVGNRSHFLGLAEDITNKKKVEEELIIAKERAEESDRLKTAFLQNISHEIRTPMNTIMGFSNLLVSEYNNKEKLDEYSQIIYNRCSDLLEIINGILDVASIESSQLSVHYDECSLKAVFNELTLFFNEYKQRIDKPDIEFTLQPFYDSYDLTIKTDSIKLKQILINLISNAFKFTYTGKIIGGYTLDENRNLIFYVSDTGIGIPVDMQGAIFERFTKLDQDKTKFQEGTGLGLTIVKGLIDLMGGKIWLESEPSKGSTFYFSIPYQNATLGKPS